jgi:flagellum-specific ATP synthase
MANEILNMMATYKKAEDLINIGAYVQGSNPRIDRAIQMVDRINSFLTQGVDEKISFRQSREALVSLFN